jgi:hypothetical protein
MSVSLEVFLKAEKLPARKVWQEAIDAEEINLQLDEADTRTQVGFWPCKLNGTDCGFEYFFGKAELHDKPKKARSRSFWSRLFGTNNSEPEQPDVVRQAVGDRDHIVEFDWHSSVDDGRAAAFAAAVLAKISDGYFLDPQSGEFTPGKDAVALGKSQDRTEQDMKMEQAVKKWATATQRRCPKCSAPCPEYRPRCFVCNFEIGRA